MNNREKIDLIKKTIFDKTDIMVPNTKPCGAPKIYNL